MIIANLKENITKTFQSVQINFNILRFDNYISLYYLWPLFFDARKAKHFSSKSIHIFI
jgi:hypothetical protein